MKPRIRTLYAGLVAGNLAAWVWAVVVFRHYPVLLGTALVAYSLGLRHAVDADHIAAIDNVTRKLMQERQQPVTVGMWFSLGHSTVVFIGAGAIAGATLALQGRIGELQVIGGVVGTSLSALFLFAIAVVNLMVWHSVHRAFRRVRAGGSYQEEDVSLLTAGGGILARLFRPMFGMIRSSLGMYPLGLLFGLGFDTATEIGLLGIAAAEAAKGLSLTAVLVFPALFTAGMALVDSSDGVLMVGAYGWAFAKPVRKLFYNLTITAISALVALAVGGVEALGLFGNEMHLGGRFWAALGTINQHFGTVGYAIIGLFVVSWLIAIAIYKWQRLDTAGPLDNSPSPRAIL
ncbi:MAG: HoxN/HupN/NixA family nickel/cobalt transporter [Acidobacteria bacterium]|nr:MAG: HoxN/HupN/NixA family nickel/cobalt transporter [Acidobacteriota bacterium]